MLEEILDDGNIPVIQVHTLPDSGLPLRLSMVPYNASSKIAYIAFSHVWSHGRGNPQGNTMYLCQLYNLAELSQQAQQGLSGPITFWIDTLCVPLVPDSARKKAILQMRDVYSEAFATVVLDEAF